MIWQSELKDRRRQVPLSVTLPLVEPRSVCCNGAVIGPWFPLTTLQQCCVPEGKESIDSKTISITEIETQRVVLYSSGRGHEKKNDVYVAATGVYHICRLVFNYAQICSCKKTYINYMYM
ncbi:uncharacterized protein LOC143213990 isoform X1 [Lasioglossum baleicum]|uniref:uncharacterized protein LOC143213990 isoform X1 n=1 Tax=Lasioglossum baleicum TaxID=434251 RepID=UPI003FCE0DB2